MLRPRGRGDGKQQAQAAEVVPFQPLPAPVQRTGIDPDEESGRASAEQPRGDMPRRIEPRVGPDLRQLQLPRCEAPGDELHVMRIVGVPRAVDQPSLGEHLRVEARPREAASG